MLVHVGFAKEWTKVKLWCQIIMKKIFSFQSLLDLELYIKNCECTYQFHDYKSTKNGKYE